MEVISPGSGRKDRGDKYFEYEVSGIPEYWLINLPQQVIEVYREPHFTGYGSTILLRPGDQARVQAFPDVAIEVENLLQRAR